MSIPSDLSGSGAYELPAAAGSSKAAAAESVSQNTLKLLPSYQGDITHILPEPPKIGSHEDDLLVHHDRINAIDGNLTRACDAVQKIFRGIGDKVQKEGKEWPELNHAMEKLVQDIDAARSQAAHGQFAEAAQACSDALKAFQQTCPSEKEFPDHIDEKFDKKILTELFTQAKAIIENSVHFAEGTCNACDSYLAELNKAASSPVEEPDKSLVAAAFKDLHNARASLQEILDGKQRGNIGQAKAKVREASAQCHALTWQPANDQIAVTQMQRKAKLAAALIPNATKEKIIGLATFGTPDKPSEVSLRGKQYEVAHDKEGSLQVVQLPVVEDALGKGFSNIVMLAYNTSKVSLQALRKSRTPEGQEAMESSLAIHKDISRLQGTTAGPEAIIRKGRGGVLSSVYGNNALGWLKTMPPSEYRWKAFRSALSSFIEFARDGNVHGDIALVNLSVEYDKGKQRVYAAPTILKLEDLDGACHIIEGYDKKGRPIYSEKAIGAGMTPAYGTPEEIIRWQDCLQRKDLEGLANVRFPQDILSIGIALYQIVTGDIDLENLYLNMERTPRNNRPGEDGEFKSGKPNIESIRLALEDYEFLTQTQKDEIVAIIAKAINLSPGERAKLQDLENAMAAL